MIGSLNPARIFHQMVLGDVPSYMVKSKPHGPSTNHTMTQTTYTVMVTIMPENRKSETSLCRSEQEVRNLAKIVMEAWTLRGF